MPPFYHNSEPGMKHLAYVSLTSAMTCNLHISVPHTSQVRSYQVQQPCPHALTRCTSHDSLPGPDYLTLDTLWLSDWTAGCCHSWFAATAPEFLNFGIQTWDHQRIILQSTSTKQQSITDWGVSIAPQTTSLHLQHPAITVGTHTHSITP